MCGLYELKTNFKELPSILKEDVPKNLENSYKHAELIQPNDPVMVLKNEGKISTSFMVWGFISEWAKNPYHPSIPRPFNARAETVCEKTLFKGSWKHKRCLLPASSFLEKGHRITRKDAKTFWLGGIWNRWMGSNGSEIETCCVLTTKSNDLIKPLHSRMPVIIPYGLEEKWIEPLKSVGELRELEEILGGWSPEGWLAEPINQPSATQISLF